MIRFKKIALSMTGGMMISCLLATAAPAQEQTYKFDIPAQDLGSALRAFGQAANQQIMFSEDTVRGERSATLVGRYPADEALRYLTADTGIRVHQNESGMIVLADRSIPSANNTAPAVPGKTATVEPTAVPEADATVEAAALFEAAGAPVTGTTDAPVKNVEEIVVTGTRIRRQSYDSAAPVTVFQSEDMADRGYFQVGQFLNDITSNAPDFPIGQAQGFPAGTGQTHPNLFNLGAGRTLTLVNGRRMVSTVSGLGDRVVDTNIIPAGLIERVEIVHGGGAAVYGSDAIAGVVNYILKSDFQGVEVDLQGSVSSRGDDRRPYARITAGRNFADDRGNVAVNLEYSKTHSLLEYDRPWTASARRRVSNAADTGPSDGIPSTIDVFNGRGWFYNRNGVVYEPRPFPPFFAGMFTSAGEAYQFSPDGTQVIPYDRGQVQAGSSTAVGGDGLDFRELSTFASGVERYSATAVAHFDLTDSARLIGEVVYGRREGADPYGTQAIFRTMFNSYSGGAGLVPFDRTHPFLTQDAVDTLSALSPSFAGGGTLYLARSMDILPTRNRPSASDTWRALAGLEGDFEAGDRSFYWTVTHSRGVTSGYSEVYAPYATHLNNALDSTVNGSGTIVCSINADADPNNDDSACVPINPFGDTDASPEALAYATTTSGSSFKNVQDDFLATIGGDLLSLPAGPAGFSVAYEHRRENAELTPYEADLLGQPFNCCASQPAEESYSTDELSAELLVPIVGGDFTLPAVSALEANGSFRYVDNSIAGRENVWGAGLRWDTGHGVTFRVSRSRNFRAPTLEQLFAPSSVGHLPIGADPCDADWINSGPDPATRRSNCQALFDSNPGFGPLEGFQDPAENTSLTQVTTGGNPNLKNEVSDTLTFGLVLQPEFIPGLTITADRIEVDLEDGLTQFGVASFLAVCYDSTDYPNEACSTFTRNDQGYVTEAQSTTFNAAIVQYHGEIYNLNYQMPLDRLFGKDLGTIEYNIAATHTALALTNSTGFNPAESQGTVTNPDWRARFDVHYSDGPFRLFYQLYYLPEVKSDINATIENTPTPYISSNIRHTLSAQYELSNVVTLRAGVNNLTDEGPSFPTRNYGDIFGRQYFLGATLRLR